MFPKLSVIFKSVGLEVMKNLENYGFDISLWKHGPCDTDSPIEIRNLGWKRQLNEAFTSKQWLNQITVEV